MKIVLQRVSNASVSVENEIIGRIDNGLLVLLGIENDDNTDDIKWLVRKISNMRIFNDADGTMNLSIIDTKGSLLIISQFTLHASIKKGNRPSYIKAAKPEIAIPLYNEFIDILKLESKLEVQTGKFGADMKVKLINDGPVTILLDSKEKV